MRRATTYSPVFCRGDIVRLAKVVGNIVSTLKPDSFKGGKLLLINPIGLDEETDNNPEVAIDLVDAGPGDVVLVVNEGNTARQLLKTDKIPVRTLVVGVVDHFNVD